MKSTLAAVILVLVAAILIFLADQDEALVRPDVDDLALAPRAGIFLIGNDRGMIRPWWLRQTCPWRY